MNRVLMVAFHYPPCSTGSGSHRTLKFSRYLPHSDWEPTVLTAHPRAYERSAAEELGEVPRDLVVTRAFALDAQRHLSFGRRYARWMALPDRWVAWLLGAIPAGLRLIRQRRPSVIWSTYPIATAHLVALVLHRLTGLPWVADFRDPMTEDGYPTDPTVWRAYRRIEQRVARHASHLVFTAESTADMYRARYPSLTAERCVWIPNGYDEADFEHLVAGRSAGHREGPLRLLHSGLVYPEERDPRPFFRAIARLRREGRLNERLLQVDLRASGAEEYYGPMLKELAIDSIVRLLPPLPHRQALQECLDADVLLLLQGASCNGQIPAKAYEYLRAKRPILALTPANGETGKLFRQSGGATRLDIDDEKMLYAGLPEFLDQVRRGAHPLPDTHYVARCARRYHAGALAEVLAAAASTAGDTPATGASSCGEAALRG